jgi:hypothetical protein
MAGTLYLVMQFIQVTFAISLLGTAAYFMSQSVPALIYLSLNQAIRRTVWKKLCCGIKKRGVVSSVSMSQHSSAPNRGRQVAIH